MRSSFQPCCRHFLRSRFRIGNWQFFRFICAPINLGWLLRLRDANESSSFPCALATQNPRNIFQVLNAGEPFVQIIAAIAHAKRDPDRLEYPVTERKLLAF